MSHTRSSKAAFWESKKQVYKAQTVNGPFIILYLKFNLTFEDKY